MIGKILAGAAALMVSGAGVASANEVRYELTDSSGALKESRSIPLRLNSDYIKLESVDKEFLGGHRERLEGGNPKVTLFGACDRLRMIAEGIIKRDRLDPINRDKILEGELKLSGIWNGVESVCFGYLDGQGGLPDWNAGGTPAGAEGCTEHGTAVNDEGTTYDVTPGGC